MLNTLYQEALDRKTNPKEGSYTNYLYTKGLDKILKKVGEESTEVVLAAKNADKDEISQEVADLLYHLAVLLVETEVQLSGGGNRCKKSRGWFLACLCSRW